MNKPKYKVYNGKKIGQLFENSKTYFLLFQFAAGIAFGAFAVSENNEKLRNIAEVFAASKNTGSFLKTTLNSFEINGLFIVISTFLGFSLIGCPLIYILMFLRGCGIGTLCGYMYIEHKLVGIGYSLLTIYPSLIISVFALIMSCRNSSEYSQNAFEKSVRGRGQFEKDETRIFIARQAVFLVLTAASAITDALCSVIFSRFFAV